MRRDQNEQNKNTKFFVIYNNWASIVFSAFIYSKKFRKIVIGFILSFSIGVINLMLEQKYHNETLSTILNLILIVSFGMTLRIMTKSLKNEVRNIFGKK